MLERRGDRLLVEIGALRFELPSEELESIDTRMESTVKVGAGGWTGPAISDGRLEVDLRGLRVEEMDLELQRALDEAILHDQLQLRIVHGTGTGGAPEAGW